MNQKAPTNFSFSDFPPSPGVYLMKNANGDVLYVGKAKHLRQRIKNYFGQGGDGRMMIPYLIKQVTAIETIVVPSEKEALILENTLIKKHQPKYNALLKDDKTFLSIMLNTSHSWPMLKVARLKGRLPKKDVYFGPYPHGAAARQTLELMRTLFPLRQCSDHELTHRSRPCILYDLKRCIAPCCQKCTKEEYQALVDQAITFLKGKDKAIAKRLQEEMKAASELLDFERAGRLYQLLQAIEETTEPLLLKTQRHDLDLFAIARRADHVVVTEQIYREGRLTHSQDFHFSKVVQEDEALLESFLLQHYEGLEGGAKHVLLSIPLSSAPVVEELIGRQVEHPKSGIRKRLLEMALLNAQQALERAKEEDMEAILLSLKENLHLTHYPERIECLDQSNLGGTHPVGAIVTYFNGVKETKGYRTYRLQAADDYGGLEEVLRRRFRKADRLPDLLLIDGGKGHLNVALAVLSELDISTIDVVAIAKEEGRHDKGMTQERCFIPQHAESIDLPIHSGELFYLQRIRDEAHRFVLGFQTKRRKQGHFTSELDQLEGIGPIKKQRLLTVFGSVKRIRAATVEEWQAVPGITKKNIETLKQWVSTDQENQPSQK